MTERDACAIGLDVEHYASICPSSRRECGVYGCQLNNHPLPHRLQYSEPFSSEDDSTFNRPRHQQARQDGAEQWDKCHMCQDQHDMRAIHTAQRIK